MHSEVFAIDDCRDGHAIEALHKQVVHIVIETSNHLFSKGEVFSHISTLMIASKQYHTFWIVHLNYIYRMKYFDAKESEDNFNAEDSPVDIVSQEQVVNILGISCLLKHMD